MAPPDRRKGEAIYLRVVKAVVEGVKRLVFIAADQFSAEMAKSKKFKEGDLIRVWFGKEREHRSWVRIHALGKLMTENVPGFEHLTAHEAIKRLQREAEVECDHVAIPGVEYTCPDCGAIHDIPNLTIVTPRSLAYEELDQIAFNAVYTAIAKHIVSAYWPDMSEAELENMASLVGMGN